MKKIIIFILILFMSTGCATQNIHKQTGTSTVAAVSTLFPGFKPNVK